MLPLPPGPVVHDDLLAQRLGEPGAHGASKRVHASTGGEGHDEPNRTRGEILLRAYGRRETGVHDRAQQD